MGCLMQKNAIWLENGNDYCKHNHWIAKICNSEVLWFSETEKNGIVNKPQGFYI